LYVPRSVQPDWTTSDGSSSSGRSSPFFPPAALAADHRSDSLQGCGCLLLPALHAPTATPSKWAEGAAGVMNPLHYVATSRYRHDIRHKHTHATPHYVKHTTLYIPHTTPRNHHTHATSCTHHHTRTFHHLPLLCLLSFLSGAGAAFDVGGMSGLGSGPLDELCLSILGAFRTETTAVVRATMSVVGRRSSTVCLPSVVCGLCQL
jgi:hypothetical protein